MSESYQRRKVISVSNAVLPMAACGAILAATALAGVVGSLSKKAAEVYRKNVTPPSPEQRKIVCSKVSLQCANPSLKTGGVVLSATEALKVSTLVAVSSSPCLIERSPKVTKTMEALCTAKNLSDAKIAQNALFKELESGHRKVFVKSLSLVCANAAIKAGFPTVRENIANGMTRIVATDRLGRALVTEIESEDHQEPNIITEVVGISDGSCRKIIDTFDQYLEEHGVKSAPPKRKFTGGVCDTAAALEYIRNKFAKQKPGAITGSANFSGERRIQRLNQRKQVKQTL
ncbi:MAG: hypothetical protein JW884_01245 [Deltaproteobacteria bacterium]|nr:hypothetical protein [Deltaproteobacteria bacterium]